MSRAFRWVRAVVLIAFLSARAWWLERGNARLRRELAVKTRLRDEYDAVMEERGRDGLDACEGTVTLNGTDYRCVVEGLELAPPTPTTPPTATPTASTPAAGDELLRARARLDRLMAAARDVTENVGDDVIAGQVDHAVQRFNQFGEEGGPDAAQAVVASFMAVGAMAVLEARLDARARERGRA